MSKFSKHTYWKHSNCKDVFFAAYEGVLADSGTTASLRGTWCTQGLENWWFTVADNININQENYDQWQPYTPKGNPKL